MQVFISPCCIPFTYNLYKDIRIWAWLVFSNETFEVMDPKISISCNKTTKKNYSANIYRNKFAHWIEHEQAYIIWHFQFLNEFENHRNKVKNVYILDKRIAAIAHPSKLVNQTWEIQWFHKSLLSSHQYQVAQPFITCSSPRVIFHTFESGKNSFVGCRTNWDC